MPYSTRIAAGELRHTIQILELNTDEDKSGGVAADDTSLFATVPAKIEALTAREAEAAGQIVPQVTHKITMRWMDGITSEMKVSFESRQFEIQAVQDPDERKKMLVLLCLERADSAFESPA
jgi:SPP1 family predicted phage head-tail adaptor